jgi:lipopolysaccharide transport system ATP-binding protein
LPAASWGSDQESLQRLAPSIIDFSELQDAIDRPIKTYSSGMVVRLAFALVTAVQPEVLIIDEALGWGTSISSANASRASSSSVRPAVRSCFVLTACTMFANLCTKVLWLQDGQTPVAW